MARFIQSSHPEVILIETDVFVDERGFYTETYHQRRFKERGISLDFVQESHSRLVCDTLRGLHYQLKHAQSKLIYVVSGEIFDVVVDIRIGSPLFGRWSGVVLSERNKRQIFVPEGFAHGYCILSDSADVITRFSDFYAPEDEYSLAWNDPDLLIDWPTKTPLLSHKDANNPTLKNLPKRALPKHKPENSGRAADRVPSCFISHSTLDEDFAKKMYKDLENSGIRCWYAPEDMEIGDNIRQKIFDSISKHDKLLLVLSKNSIYSRWVESEVEAAFRKERVLEQEVLFPVRIDSAIMETDVAWAQDVRNKRHIEGGRSSDISVEIGILV